MYDLTWARQVVRSWAVLCTRAQLLSGEFTAFQEDLGLSDKKITLEDALTYTLAASQGSAEATRAWNAFKKMERRAPWKQFATEDSFRDILVLGLRRGRLYRQACLF